MSAVQATAASGTAASADDQVHNLYSLFVLAMMMSDGRGEEAILRLAATAVPQLGRCRVVAGYLVRDGELNRVPVGPQEPGTELLAQVAALRGLDGPVHPVGRQCWVWAYPLRSLESAAGYLVVTAECEPSTHERFLLKVLAQQTGAALSHAASHRAERELSGRLRTLSAELAAVNMQLCAAVAALQWQCRIHEVFSQISAAAEGEAGVARAVHQLTGLAVAVEDRFGNLRAWAGPDRPDPYPKPSGPRRSQLLARALRDCRPVREGSRVLALAQPRHDVLGVLALIDPQRVAGEHEMFILEHGAGVLAEELAHQRSLTEVELRLRRDLVDDLLSGASDASVFTRAEALGHDLHRPHRVLVVRWNDGIAHSDVARVVGRVGTAMQMGCLLAIRAGSIVLLAQRPGGRSDDRRCWEEMYRGVARELRCGSGAIGVGGAADTVAEVCRSHDEALRALSVRLESVNCRGVSVFDELGVYRVLAAGQNSGEIRTFVREWLGPLLDYDSGHRCELVRTLSVYLECGGNYDDTAGALTIHRSTLRYRLQRIREVSGLDLGEVDSRFNLHVATRAWRVLQGSA